MITEFDSRHRQPDHNISRQPTSPINTSRTHLTTRSRTITTAIRNITTTTSRTSISRARRACTHACPHKRHSFHHHHHRYLTTYHSPSPHDRTQALSLARTDTRLHARAVQPSTPNGTESDHSTNERQRGGQSNACVHEY